MKKTSIDLVSDLDRAGKNWGNALLIVGFPTETRVVPSGFSDGLQRLDSLLQQGGIPVGMVSMKTINGEDHAFCSVLEDRVDDDWAEPYVMAFADKMLTAKPGEIFTHSTGIDEFRTRQNLAMNTMRQRRNRGGFKSPEPPLEEAPMENPFKVRKIKLDPDAREINLEALIEDSLKDASGPLKERLALKGNRSTSEFLLEHVKLAILELEPDLDATSQDFRTAVILMAAAFIVGPRIDLLVAFTGYPRPAVAEISRRMRANGLWRDDGVRAYDWFDGDKVTGAFWMDCLVADGVLHIERSEDGEEFYAPFDPESKKPN